MFEMTTLHRLLLVGLVGALLFGATRLEAQRYQVKTYGLREGLPTAEIGSIAQDGAGRIWFSSRLGLISYDGLRWSIETPEKLQGGESFYFVRSDARGRLWTLSGTKAFLRENEVWSALPPIQERFRTGDEVPIDFRVLKVQDELRPVVIYSSSRIFVFNGDAWRSITVGDESGPSTIRSAEPLPSDGQLLLTTTRGVLRVNLDSGQCDSLELPTVDGGIHGLAYDSELGVIWFIGTFTVGQIPVESVTADSPRMDVLGRDLDLSNYFGPNRPIRTSADGRGGFYFGNYAFLGHYDRRQGVEILHRENGLIAEGAHDILLDREQNVWVATSRGVSKIISRRFAGYDSEHKLFDDEVTAVRELADGSIILGHNGGLSRLKNRQVFRLDLTAGPTKGRVMDIAIDKAGRIWIACEQFGIVQVAAEPDGRLLVRARHNPPPSTAVNSLVFDLKEKLWAGTTTGLYRFENDAFSPVEIDAGSDRKVQVRRVTTGPSGRIFVATTNRGLLVIEGNKITINNEPVYLRNTYTAFEASDGQVWVGARDGLCLLGDERLYFPEEFEVRRPVYGIVEDRNGRIWAGTDNGVYRWNKEKLDHVNTENGLIGLEINRAANFMDSRGRVWIGTDRGVSVFDPDEEVRESNGPTLELLTLDVDGTSYDLDEPLSLAHDAKNLTFSFRAISFVDEARLRFRSRLIGFDDTWSELRLLPLHEIRYSNLPPGSYQLEIVAVDIDGREGPVVRSEVVEVDLPFWLEIWFLAAVIVSVAALGAGLYKMWAQRRQAQRLEEEIRIRTEELQRSVEAQARIARLDSLGILAGGIAHDFNNLLTAIGGGLALIEDEPDLDDDLKETVAHVEKACWKAQALTRQLLTFSRGGEPMREVASLPEILADAASFSLRGSAIESRFEIEDDLPPVLIDIGQFHQVFNNLLINARQAMPRGGHIDIKARKVRDDDRDLVEVEVHDNGIGIDEKDLPHIFDPYFSTKPQGNGLGLAIAHSIVRKHDGSIEAKSRAGSGSTFTLRIPATDKLPEGGADETPAFRKLEGRVLIMDDQETVRAFTRRAMERLGLEVVDCGDGAAALALYDEAYRAGRRFDVVLMDLTVPGGVGGLEATANILKVDASARIIVTTGYSQDAALADYKQHGFRDRLPKPFSPEDLSSVLARTLR